MATALARKWDLSDKKLFKCFTPEEKAEYYHKRYEKDRERRLQYRKEYYQKHKEEIKKRNRNYYKIKCGLKIED